MLRGEARHAARNLFARLLAAAGAPFIEGPELLAEVSSDRLARAGGGVLFVGRSRPHWAGVEQKQYSSSCWRRADKAQRRSGVVLDADAACAGREARIRCPACWRAFGTGAQAARAA
jgi:hypothetical protein